MTRLGFVAPAPCYASAGAASSFNTTCSRYVSSFTPAHPRSASRLQVAVPHLRAVARPTMSMDTSLVLATASQQAYQRYLKAEPKDIDGWVVQPVTFISAEEDFVLIYKKGDDVIVAFRGTSSTKDWVHDVELFRSEKFVPTRPQRTPPKTTIFKGFANIYDGLREKLVAYLDAQPTKGNLYITGHSLGGALAAIFSMDAMCTFDGYKKIHIETFASPRPGHKDFSDAFGKMMKDISGTEVVGKRWSAHDSSLNHFWEVDDGDVIPLLPQFWFEAGVHIPLEPMHFIRAKFAYDAHIISNYIGHLTEAAAEVAAK